MISLRCKVIGCIAGIFFLSVMWSLALAQSTLTAVYGKAPDYANQTIVFRQQVGFVTDAQLEIGRVTLGRDGDFYCPLKVQGTQKVTCEVGAYLLYFYITQGQRYELGFPPYRPMQDQDRLNPYQPRMEVQLRPRGVDSLLVNDMIARYDYALAAALDSVMMGVTVQKQRVNADSLVTAVRKRFAGAKYEDQFFREYIRYQEGNLFYVTQTKYVQQLSDEYFKNRPILYDNPAYRDLFNAVYMKYFQFHGRTREGRQIYKAITQDRSLSGLARVLRQNDNLQPDALMELVMLKGIHDEFFDVNFSRESLSVVLDSLSSHTDVAEHAYIASYIREKVTRLLPGFAPYPVRITDVRGQLLDIKQLRGKLTLLMFAITTSYTCIEDFTLLRKLLLSYGEHLEVVTLCADENTESAVKFIESQGYDWHFAMLEEQKELLEHYDVRAFPTYYLLDERGLLLYSPVRSPREGLESLLFQLFRQRGWRPKELQNQNRRIK